MRQYALFLFALIGIGCGSAAAPTGTLTEAWALYTQNRYDEAYLAFQELVPDDPTEANVGLGWCCIGLDSVSRAGNFFSLASATTVTNDAYAGWSAVLWTQKDFQGCIDKTAVVLSNDPNFVFSHRPSVDFRDLIWYQASSYLHLSQYAQCLVQIQKLDSIFSANLSDANIADILATKLESLSKNLSKQ
jgi:hypothetical protein